MAEVQINTVNIKIGKKELSLTIDEVKQLKEALEGLLNAQVVHVHHDHWYWRNWQPTYTPVWGTVSCNTTNASGALCMQIGGGSCAC